MSKKKIIRSIFSLFGAFIAIIAVVGFVFVIILLVKSLRVGYEPTKDYWSILNNSFIIFGAVGTLMAVIVALFKEKISSLLYSPDFSFELAQPLLNIQKETNNLSLTEKYYTKLRVYNRGTLDAKNCSIDITTIEYDKNRKAAKRKRIYPISQTPIELNKSYISKGDFIEIPLFEVYNPTAAGTPGDSSKPEKATISFNGLELSNDVSYCGLYTIHYRLFCDSGFSESFCITVDWAGEWSDNLSDMADKFEVKID